MFADVETQDQEYINISVDTEERYVLLMFAIEAQNDEVAIRVLDNCQLDALIKALQEAKELL